MTTLFKVALLQLSAAQDFSKNLAKGIEACSCAKALGADLALFPEVWQVGYDATWMHSEHALDKHDPFIVAFQNRARDLQMVIAITYLGKGASGPTNSALLIDWKGHLVLDYAKVHTCEFDVPENRLEPGKSFKVVPLKFARGTVNIGVMICFDRQFPESARTLMLKGAEMIITPNSCYLQEDPVLGDVRLQQFRSRAFENMVGVALSNYPKPKNDGHSCAFDANGKPLIIANDQEGIFLAEFDLDRIREWQKNEVWGAKYRHPECYD